MGLFDFFKGKQNRERAIPEKEAQNPTTEQESAPSEREAVHSGVEDKEKEVPSPKEKEEIDDRGWRAIENECQRVYPGQTEPKHYGTILSWELGGNDPLRGISVYDGGNFYHFVTFGLSELYEKESEDLEYSGYGMEFTFKLKKADYEDEEGEINNVINILQALARITFTSGEIFQPYEFIYTGQTTGIDAYKKSNLTGFITVPDPDFKPLDTPNGKVEFVEFIGCTDDELVAVRDKKITVKEFYEALGTDVTSYNRESVYSVESGN